jgi:hypothetical protein
VQKKKYICDTIRDVCRVVGGLERGSRDRTHLWSLSMATPPKAAMRQAKYGSKNRSALDTACVHRGVTWGARRRGRGN